MPRRVGLPGASELFRTTSTPPTSSSASPATPEPTDESSGAAPSGRVRHEEKITVYVSSTELLALERARLELRGRRGRQERRARTVRTAPRAPRVRWAPPGRWGRWGRWEPWDL